MNGSIVEFLVFTKDEQQLTSESCIQVHLATMQKNAGDEIIEFLKLNPLGNKRGYGPVCIKTKQVSQLNSILSQLDQNL